MSFLWNRQISIFDFLTLRQSLYKVQQDGLKNGFKIVVKTGLEIGFLWLLIKDVIDIRSFKAQTKIKQIRLFCKNHFEQN